MVFGVPQCENVRLQFFKMNVLHNISKIYWVSTTIQLCYSLLHAVIKRAQCYLYFRNYDIYHENCTRWNISEHKSLSIIKRCWSCSCWSLFPLNYLYYGYKLLLHFWVFFKIMARLHQILIKPYIPGWFLICDFVPGILN